MEAKTKKAHGTNRRNKPRSPKKTKRITYNKLNTKSKDSTKKAWKRKQKRHMEQIEQRDRKVQI